MPGTGTPTQFPEQVHDNNGGIPLSGLFWTVELPRKSFHTSRDGRRARAVVKDLCVLDTFFFSGTNLVPSTVSFGIEWKATGPPADWGSGDTGDPTAKDAFLGSFAPAVATGWFSGEELGFQFRSRHVASSDPDGYAQIGPERNGVFL